VGLFVLGFAYQMFPPFQGIPLPWPRLAFLSLGLMTGGIVARSFGEARPTTTPPSPGRPLPAAALRGPSSTLSSGGTWEIIFWVKDGATPATQNTWGFAAYYNAGPVQVTP
jgi:hypothetical protein